MDPHALQIAQTLKAAGFIAYFAGGYVRDLLLKCPSSDVDIATDATPEEIQMLFAHTVAVGAQFGIIVVLLDGKSFEVATFRKDGAYIDGRRPLSYERARPAEDASRRDFTINGLFLDPFTGKIIDYVGGEQDLKLGIIRTIGQASERFLEDRLRIIRAIRFAYRFHFQLESATQAAIKHYAKELFPAVSIERVVQELKKMALYPSFKEALIAMYRFGILATIFPEKEWALEPLEQKPFALYPSNTPLILYLYHLFDCPPLPFMEKLWQRLKLAKAELKLIKVASSCQHLIPSLNPTHPIMTPEIAFEWVKLLAQDESAICLEVASYSQQMPPKQFLLQIEALKQQLAPAIERHRHKKNVLSANQLKQELIPAGPLMGQLLLEGEKLALQYPTANSQRILSLLKQTPLWPKT